MIHSIPATNAAAAPVMDSDIVVEPAPAMDTDAPIQAISDDEPTMVVVTPRRDFCKAKVMYVQPVQATFPPGNDELVL